MFSSIFFNEFFKEGNKISTADVAVGVRRQNGSPQGTSHKDEQDSAQQEGGRKSWWQTAEAEC